MVRSGGPIWRHTLSSAVLPGSEALASGDLVSASFGTILRRLRIAANLSQEELAKAAKMSAAAIGAYEREVRTAPHRESVDLLANALGLLGDERHGFLAAARAKSRLRGSLERVVT